MIVPVRYQVTGRGAAEIAASVEAGVRSDALPPGSSVPPVRTLATSLGVATATVAAAYKLLRDRGVVETAGRLGTRRLEATLQRRDGRWFITALRHL